VGQVGLGWVGSGWVGSGRVGWVGQVDWSVALADLWISWLGRIYRACIKQLFVAAAAAIIIFVVGVVVGSQRFSSKSPIRSLPDCSLYLIKVGARGHIVKSVKDHLWSLFQAWLPAGHRSG
jgi:hypothetical protein